MLLLNTSIALACGGFFCNPAQPVEQSGEEIVFSVDEAHEEVTMHARVAWSGEAEDFAWVVPVRGTPTLDLSVDELFFSVDAVSRPTVFVNVQDCSNSDADADADTDSDTDTDTDFDTAADPLVWVLDTQSAGLYEAVTLGASDSAALVAWLQANGFDVPSTLDTALAPYVAGDMNFLALRLRSGAEPSGTLAPIALTWSGTHPVVPLTLTAVAAQDDMPITVYVLGAHRAVPLNYLHVVLDPIAVDFADNGSNLDEVIADAADEAGGRAFATLAAMDVGPSAWQGRRASDFDLARLRATVDARDFLQQLVPAGFALDARVLDALSLIFTAPAGEPLALWLADIATGDVVYDGPFDASDATDVLDRLIVEPTERSRLLLAEDRTLTRLRSAMSADEMILDPIFGLNPDLPMVSPALQMDIVQDCFSDEQEIVWSMGAEPAARLAAPSAQELAILGLTLQQWVWTEVPTPPTLRIEQASESGPNKVLVDHRMDLEAHGVFFDGLTEATTPDAAPGSAPRWPSSSATSDGDPSARTSGCGCAHGSGGAWMALGLLAIATRRRRAR